MSGFENGNWHNANGGGLPIRPPPTVDEALPYSPFTSIVPFSPDVIPYPSTEPPTPPTTLTPDQQSSGRKALDILNNEIKGPQSTAQHLQNTLRQLKNLLNPDELTQFNFKPIGQLATPPPDTPPPPKVNGAKPPALSPFATMLLKQTDVSYFPFGVQPAERRESESVPPPRLSGPQTPARTPTQPPGANGATPGQPGKSQYPQAGSSSTPKNSQVRPGAVMIKPLPPSAPREDYHHYEAHVIKDFPQKKQDHRHSEAGISVLRPQQKEIADRKTEELRFLVASLCEEKDDLEESKNFTKVSTPEADLTVLEQKAMDRLSEKISNVANQGRFMALPIDQVLQIQSLLEPTIIATTQMALFSKDDGEIDWSEDLEKARFGLQASRLVLTTMIEGRDENRLRREDLVDGVIQLIKQLEYSCIIPVVQSRRSGELVDLFNSAMGQRKEISGILRLCGIVLSRFATLIGKVNLADRALNTIEYLSLDLLVEQNSDNDKDSVFGIQKFEHFRQNAMDVLAQIFARHEVQRSSIITGILSNLEKLPDRRQSARHFKSAREVPIMTVSALFMRFVQVAAMNNDTKNNKVALDSTEDELGQEEDESSDSNSEGGDRKQVKKKGKARVTADKLANDLYENANTIAGHVARSLVERALGVSKTGDKPFRNLLDLFIEDFCNVLGSPEWPSAVLLLSCLLRIMQGLVIGPGAAKQSNINREMALDTMATMGCGIINFKHRVKQLKRGLDISQSELSSKLDSLADDALNDSINDKDLFAFDGPYRMVIESLRDYLELLAGQEDPHLQAVAGCHITIWLHAVLQAFKPSSDDQPRDAVAIELQQRLESMIVDSKWLDREYKFQKVSVSQSQLASGIITLQSQVCQFLPNLANIMLHYTQDRSSSKLRTKGMDGLVKLLEKDPRILTEQTVKKMANLFSDESPLVRERCLSMVAKVLEQDPSLEQHFLPYVLYSTLDGSVGPKKRAIKLLKDIYRSGTSREDKLKIASTLLLPSQDNEKGIAELTRHTLEEIWLTPGADNKTDDIRNKLSRAEQTSLLVETIGKLQGKATHLEAFEKFFEYALSSNAKNPKSMNAKIMKELVADMIDRVISPESTQVDNTQAHVLHALSIFAKVGPELFTMDQVQLLKLYVKDLSGRDDLPTLRPTVTVFHYVFPSLPALQEAFAEDVRGALSRNVSKLANWAAQGVPTSRETLEEVVRCLWIVSPIVPMGIDRLITMIASILIQLRPLISCSKEVAEQKKNTIVSYLILLGTFGKICDFDQYLKKFQDKVSAMARNAAAKQPANQQQLKSLQSGITASPLVLLDAVRPFSMETWDMNIREQALLSVGQICQQCPRSFMRQDVEKMFQLVFEKQDNPRLKRISLTVFKDYFNSAERRSETGAEIAVGEGAKHGAARLDTSFVASDNDSATLHLAKRFLPYLVNIALKNDNELALLATIVITSISRQGLVHPKECGPPLAALGTSPRDEIGKPAAAEHKKIHDAHESILEKEYMSAVKMAFDYQRDVFDEPHGMRETKESKYTPKMQRLFEVLKAGSRKTLKKFIENLCKQLDFDLPKLKTSGDIPEAILFSRFCLENLGLLEFPRFDELALALNGLESIVLKNTGPAVALAIETEMPKRVAQEPSFQPQLPDPVGDSNPMPLPPQQPLHAPIGEARLRQLTVACIMLQMMWETRSFIRRCYNLHKLTGRISPKDYQRPAIRNNFVSGKDLWEHLAPVTNALTSRETMTKQCYDFAELLEVDKDAQVGEDGEDDRMAGYETPVEEGVENPAVSNSGGGRNRKRKNTTTLTNTPKKRGRTSGSKKGKRTSKTPELDDESDY